MGRREHPAVNAPAPVSAADDTALVSTRFTVPGMRCAGCIAKIERELPKIEGIAAARANFSAKRVAIRHDPALGEDRLTEALRELGFEAQPVAENPLGIETEERKRLTRAVGVAGFGMMNVMLLSVSIWSGADGATRELFHWLSALIALPVIAYSGRPFFSSAWMALSHKRTNMDVPISIGVILATGLSIYETMTGGGHAYFESAVMLLFFLLAGRTLDAVMRDRTRAGGAFQGQVSDLEIQAAEIERIRNRLDEILSGHTGQPADKIRRDTDRDNILTAAQAKEYGIVDEVFEYRKKSLKAPAS